MQRDSYADADSFRLREFLSDRYLLDLRVIAT